ncbi:MAG: PPC domain-containing protein, partial [Anaerolinea sp.]|nr:PPC domain-containing protein [Anaerolinea sp.]
MADSVCRCLLRLHLDGIWLDPVGAFGPNAPLRLVAHPDGSLVALDRQSTGYALQFLNGERSETLPLSFNAAAPPLIGVRADGSTVVIEWLSSLMDSSISGAFFSITHQTAQLIRWLPFTPEQVRDIAVLNSGQIVFALADGTIAVENIPGQFDSLLRLPAPARRLSIDDDGTLYVLLDDDQIAAYSNRGRLSRTGSPVLVSGVPVVGSVSQSASTQQWQYHGTAGERVTINAIHPGSGIGLDVALRLFAPDGRELGYNDDHLGPDLNGIYDAQIREFILPETGTYLVQVEWVQFSGSYVLLLARDHTFAPQIDAPIALNGRIFDVQPVERWVFNGSAGTALTVTMIAETGNLDPTLKLIDPYGVPLAYNDDGRDPELGTNAQIFRVTLPVSGQYVIEASRYAGSGSYTLYVVVNAT